MYLKKKVVTGLENDHCYLAEVLPFYEKTL